MFWATSPRSATSSRSTTRHPSVDLDPPYVRLVNSDGACSWAFDPVGPDAVDDGDLVPSFSMFARAWKTRATRR